MRWEQKWTTWTKSTKFPSVSHTKKMSQNHEEVLNVEIRGYLFPGIYNKKFRSYFRIVISLPYPGQPVPIPRNSKTRAKTADYENNIINK